MSQNITNSNIITMYRDVMNQHNGIIKVTKDQFRDLLEYSRAFYKLSFYNKIYEFDHNLYSKEMIENKIHFIFYGASNDDEIKLSHEECKTIFNDTLLKISNFYPAYELMTWLDMEMVKEIIDKFDTVLLPKKSKFKKYSFASLCCVHSYLEYMHQGSKENKLFQLQKIIQSARDSKRTKAYQNGYYNQVMKVHDKAVDLSFLLETKREQCEDYNRWRKNLPDNQLKMLQEYEKVVEISKRELSKLAEDYEDSMSEELEEREQWEKEKRKEEEMREYIMMAIEQDNSDAMYLLGYYFE